MKIAVAGDAFKIFGHGSEEEPTLSKPESVGHPRNFRKGAPPAVNLTTGY
jgi:hypothetical protein